MQITADHQEIRWPVLMVVSRFVLFLAWQSLIALAHALVGAANPWQASAAWWPLSITLTNGISYLLLRSLAAREGLRFTQLINADFRREHLKKDILAVLGLLLLSGPVAIIPSLGVAQLLFGDSNVPVEMFTQPLPALGALAALVLFPITMPFGELPTYFGYVMPRLANRWSSPTNAMLVSAFWLGAQHMTLPLIPDWRFMLWRLTMFIPFALLLGWSLKWRPRLLPYFMIIHALIDFPVGLSVWQVSMGG